MSVLGVPGDMTVYTIHCIGNTSGDRKVYTGYTGQKRTVHRVLTGKKIEKGKVYANKY